MLTKIADQLKKDITLQPHQVAFKDKLSKTDALLAYHGLGSGKTLSSIASTVGLKADVVVPASLRENYKKEVGKFIEGESNRNIVSYEQAAKGQMEYARGPGNALVIDEVQRLGNAGSKRSQILRELAPSYEKRILLSGTPASNHPYELAPILRMLNPDAKDIPLNPVEFNEKFIETKAVKPSIWQRLKGIKPGETQSVQNIEELKKNIEGKVHYYPTGTDQFPTRTNALHQVEMSPEQQRIYAGVTGTANPALARKVRSGLPPNKQEASQLNAFMAAARQVSNTTVPYGGEETLSPKLRDLAERLVGNPKGRHVVYSNYLGAGLESVESELKNKGVGYGAFTGKMNDKEKKQAVEDFNSGASNILLLSSAGAEGIDLKGTRNIHLMEPHWNKNKLEQVVGRGIRFGSHSHLPEKERQVTVHKYQSIMPHTRMQRLLRQPRPTSADTYLDDLAEDKQEVLDQFLNVLKEEGQK